jgi:hypothetical protein
MSKYVDSIGQELSIGDYIAIPAYDNQNKSSYIAVYKIMEFVKKNNDCDIGVKVGLGPLNTLPLSQHMIKITSPENSEHDILKIGDSFCYVYPKTLTEVGERAALIHDIITNIQISKSGKKYTRTSYGKYLLKDVMKI